MDTPIVQVGHEAYVINTDTLVLAAGDGNKAKPTQRQSASVPTNNAGGDIAYWGNDNLFPQNVLLSVETSSFVGSVLDWKARALYGGGLIMGKVQEVKDNGEEIFKPVDDKIIKDWLRKTNFNRSYLFPAISNFYYFYNVFPEFITDHNGKLADVNVLDSTACRWKKMNTSGIIETCYFNVNWKEGGTTENSVKVPVIDPWYDPAGSISRGEFKKEKFIYPLSYPTPGKNYYSLAHWNSIRESGWLDVSNSVASYKKALLKNQFTIKYLIETTAEFWKFKFPDWDALRPEEKKSKQMEVLTELSAYMKGETKAGNSILTTKFTDPFTKQQISGLTITAIDDKFKDGAYIEDSQEASSHLLYALGVDGTLIGNAPGKGMGAGSGSDKRVAFNNYISLCEIHRDLILEPLYFVRDANGWDPTIEFRFKYPIIMTLDKGKSSQQQSS